jgi:electron transfer flavoprotein alpha subunit
MLEVTEDCNGCKKCEKTCPYGAILVQDKKAVVQDNCTLCGACVQVCPFDALILHRKVEEKDLSDWKGVWVFAETVENGEVRSASKELLSKAYELAQELGEEMCAVLLGDGVESLVNECAQYGATKVYMVDKPELKEYNTDTYSTVIIGLVSKYKPSIVLYPATLIGRDLAPRIATTIHCGLTADCTGLSIKDGMLLQSRPAFGGNIMADIFSGRHRPQMATVRPNVMKPMDPLEGASAEVIKEDPDIKEDLIRVKIIDKNIIAIPGEKKIDEADIIVTGGRGAAKNGDLKELEELAQVMGAAIGVSRVVVDMGIKPKNQQVGQSGITVSPKLYIVAGVSGAIQHLVGMKSSDVIIAINTDANAPIFGVSDYGVVGDLYDIVPKLVEAIKKEKGI